MLLQREHLTFHISTLSQEDNSLNKCLLLLLSIPSIIGVLQKSIQLSRFWVEGSFVICEWGS